MFCKNGSMNHIWDLSKIDVYNVQRFFRPVIIRNKSWEKNIVKVKWGLNDLLEGLYWGDYQMDLDPVNNIILGDTYDIFDIKTVKKFYKYIDFTAEYVDHLAKYNKTETLEFLLAKFGSKLQYSSNAMDYASEHGHVNVLEWWFKSNLPLKYSENALYNASWKGHIEVLEWWFKSNRPLKYNENALNFASEYGHIHVLEWWKNSGLLLKYNESALDWASDNGHLNVLEWWKNSGLLLKYSSNIINKVIEYRHENVRKWWCKEIINH
jgi:hypothetical protein